MSHDNRILIGYDGLGLAIYDPKTGTVTDNPYYSRDVNLSTAKVYSICEDRNGNTWLGLLQKGIYMHPAKTTGFHYMGYKLGARNVIGSACVTSVLMSSNTLNWVGTDKDGLYCLDTKGQVVKHFKEGFPATILSMAEDKQGRIWIGTFKEGCGWIDSQTLTYHPYPLPQGRAVSVFGLRTDRKGQLWLATMGYGLLRLDAETGEVKSYTQQGDAGDNPKVNSLTNNYISQVG